MKAEIIVWALGIIGTALGGGKLIQQWISRIGEKRRQELKELKELRAEVERLQGEVYLLRGQLTEISAIVETASTFIKDDTGLRKAYELIKKRKLDGH